MVQRAVAARGVPGPARLRRWARAALGRRGGELTVRIVGPAEGRALNRRYRGKVRPTNVLSFSSDAPGVLGDLVGIKTAFGIVVPLTLTAIAMVLGMRRAQRRQVAA